MYIYICFLAITRATYHYRFKQCKKKYFYLLEGQIKDFTGKDLHMSYKKACIE